METSPDDQYAAFDFFVAAEHIVDWILPDSKIDQRNMRNNNDLLKITSHIANGAKHFEAKAKHHKSVSGVEKSRYVAKGYVKEGYYSDPLIIHLSPDEEGLFGTRDIEAVALAKKVLSYWQNHEIMA